MGYVLLILALVIALIIWKNKKILLKIKMFFKRYKLLIILELVILIVLLIFNVLNNTVMIMEKDPHSYKVLQSVNLKKGETYTYKTVYTNFEINGELLDIKNMKTEFKEETNIIKIEDVGINEIKISRNGIEEYYKYGKGFSYNGSNSCMCGTQIIFEKSLSNFIKILAFSVIIIDLVLIIFTRMKEENK